MSDAPPDRPRLRRAQHGEPLAPDALTGSAGDGMGASEVQSRVDEEQRADTSSVSFQISCQPSVGGRVSPTTCHVRSYRGNS